MGLKKIIETVNAGKVGWAIFFAGLGAGAVTGYDVGMNAYEHKQDPEVIEQIYQKKVQQERARFDRIVALKHSIGEKAETANFDTYLDEIKDQLNTEAKQDAQYPGKGPVGAVFGALGFVVGAGVGGAAGGGVTARVIDSYQWAIWRRRKENLEKNPFGKEIE